MADADVDAKELTNFDRLAAALPEAGIARALLNAWRTGDIADRVDRLVKVAQPSNAEPETDDVTSED